MKRSLWLASILLMVLALGCKPREAQNASKQPAENTQAGTTTESGASTGTGTGTGTSVDGAGTGKPTQGGGTPKPINHGSPDQTKLDSIKAAKEKGKN